MVQFWRYNTFCQLESLTPSDPNKIGLRCVQVIKGFLDLFKFAVKGESVNKVK